MVVTFFLFPGITALDAVGPYEVLSRVPGWEVRFAAKEPGPQAADTGVTSIDAPVSLEEAAETDVLLVPGGAGTRRLLHDEPILDWIRRGAASAEWITSVCTGSLLLGAAGLLGGRRATSHWLQLERLREFGAEPVAERVVEDGRLITAAGVSSGIDMALALVGRIAGPELAGTIQLSIEYDPDPPFDSGSPAKAGEERVEVVSSVTARHDEWLSARRAGRSGRS